MEERERRKGANKCLFFLSLSLLLWTKTASTNTRSRREDEFFKGIQHSSFLSSSWSAFLEGGRQKRKLEQAEIMCIYHPFLFPIFGSPDGLRQVRQQQVKCLPPSPGSRCSR